jgi:hypothetical protein
MRIVIEGIELSDAQQKEPLKSREQFLAEIERLCGKEIVKAAELFWQTEAERLISGDPEAEPIIGLLS